MRLKNTLIERLESRRLLDGTAGQLDVTFDGDGRSLMPFGAGELVGSQPDGKIIVRRTDVGGFRLARVNTDGSIDTTFLGGATLTAASGTLNFDVNPADGRIAFIAPTSNSKETKVGVFKADGSPDPSFDHDGIRVLTFGYTESYVAWQGDKLIMLGGPYTYGNEIGFNKATLVRINGDGSQDLSFGTSGSNTLTSTPEKLTGLDVGGDSKIVVSADYHENGLDDLRVSRFTVNGQPDTSFGAGSGYIDAATSTSNPYLTTQAIHVEADNSISHLSTEGDGTLRVRRFKADGSNFLTSGKLDLPGDPNQTYYATLPRQIGLQPDGKILLIGQASNDFVNPYGWLIMRVNTDGTLDSTYGVTGAAFPKVTDNGRAIIQNDGKVLVSGSRIGGTDAGTFQVLRIDTGAMDLGTITLNRKGTLIVTGTSRSEELGVRFRARDSRIVAWVGNVSRAMAPSKVKRIALFAGAGNDLITIGAGVRGSYLGGEDGADTLNGGDGDDVLVGGLQGDKMYGNLGNDTLVGEGGDDYCLGGAGNDVLYGNGGVDTLNGAGGNDRLFGGDAADFINGGAGIDSAAQSSDDKFSEIETLLTA